MASLSFLDNHLKRKCLLDRHRMQRMVCFLEGGVLLRKVFKVRRGWPYIALAKYELTVPYIFLFDNINK